MKLYLVAVALSMVLSIKLGTRKCTYNASTDNYDCAWGEEPKCSGDDHCLDILRRNAIANGKKQYELGNYDGYGGTNAIAF